MKRLGALALLLGTLGCNTLYVDYPSPDPGTLDLSKRHVVTSRGCGFALLAFIPLGVNDRMDRAWTQLRKRAGRNVITDVEQRETWMYLGAGTLWCSHMTANAYPRLGP
jgi:hypothetical protein